MKIKSPVPLTVAVLPSHLADQFYDKTITLSEALDQTGCKEQGVQSLGFNRTFNVANGPQTIRRTRKALALLLFAIHRFRSKSFDTLLTSSTNQNLFLGIKPCIR